MKVNRAGSGIRDGNNARTLSCAVSAEFEAQLTYDGPLRQIQGFDCPAIFVVQVYYLESRYPVPRRFVLAAPDALSIESHLFAIPDGFGKSHFELVKLSFFEWLFANHRETERGNVDESPAQTPIPLGKNPQIIIGAFAVVFSPFLHLPPTLMINFVAIPKKKNPIVLMFG